MGWNISHGTDSNGEIRRSYTSIGNLADRLKTVLPPQDWAILQPVIAPRGSADPHEVEPILAVTVADILERAARSWRMKPGGWHQLAREIAAAARRAAAAGENWHWR